MKPLSFSSFIVVVAMSAASLVANGCGGIDCTETATCPGLSDGSSDQSVTEGGGASGQDVQAEPLTDASEADTPSNASDANATMEEADAGDGSTDSTDEDVGTDSTSIADAQFDAPDARGPDAAPPTCANGSSCVKAAPAGWFGPGALFDGAFTASPPACVAPYGNNAFTLSAMPTSPAPACGCACGGVNGGCTNPTVAVYSDNQCGPSNDCASGGGAACTATEGARCPTGGQSANVTALPQATSTGSCNASVTTLNTPTPQWTRTGETCAASQTFTSAGCASGSVCAPDAPSRFQPKLCVWKAMAADCSTPALSGYSLVYRYYSRMTDTRACTKGTCGCNAASVSACTLTATAYRTPNCSSGGTVLANSGCSFSGNLIAGLTASVVTTGSCAPNGSAGTSGTVVPDNATEFTVCCTQ